MVSENKDDLEGAEALLALSGINDEYKIAVLDVNTQSSSQFTSNETTISDFMLESIDTSEDGLEKHQKEDLMTLFNPLSLDYNNSDQVRLYLYKDFFFFQ